MKFAQTAALAVAIGLASTVSAGAYSQKVKDACAGDYQNYCSQYIPESARARRCFEANRKSLSKICVSALVEAGEVPRRYLRK